ncbi:MAG: ATP-binding protein [Candidatus Cyclobacteriaceae bacterium M2_1C_046]
MEVKQKKHTTTSASERENFLKEVIHATVGSNNLHFILRSLAAKIGSFFKADRVYIINYDERGKLGLDTDSFYLAEGVSPVNFDEFPLKEQKIPVGDTSKTFRLVYHIYRLSEAPEHLKSFLRSNNINSVVVYEFFFNGIPYGRFALHYSKSDKLKKDDISLLESVLGLISNVIYQNSLLKNEQKARQEREMSSKELRSLIDAIPAFISFVTPELKYKYYNKYYTTYFGLSEKELFEKGIKKILGERSYRISEKMIKRVLKGENVSFVNKIPNKDGQFRNIHIQYTPNYDPDGSINGFFVLGNDITETKAAEKKLEEQKERLRLTIESTQMGTWDHNFVTSELSLSDRTKELLEIRKRDYVSYEEFLNKIYPEDKAGFKQFLEDIIMGEGQKDHNFEFRTTNNRWLNASGQLFVDSENQDIRLIGLIENITDQKKHEEYLTNQRQHFYNIFNDASSLICVLKGPELHIEYVNNTYREKFYSHNIIGMKIEEAFPELAEQGHITTLKKVYDRGRASSGKEVMVTFVNKSGLIEEGYFNYLFHPRFNSKGKVDGVVVYVNEITELVNSRKSLESFISMASHELKTPLTSVSAYSELIDEDLNEFPDTQARKHIDKMRVNIQRLQNLINELLDVSRIQAGKVIYNFSRFQYSTFIEECIENNRLVYPDHKFHLNISTTAELNGDQDRLEQVMNNLISNAVKYAPDSKEIIIEVKDYKETVFTTISDKGIGIPYHLQKDLFQRFFRVETNKFRPSGLGIGLFICKGIIQGHKGDIGVKSEPGEGSTFYFNLPKITS